MDRSDGDDVAVEADLSVTVEPAGWLRESAPGEARVWGDGATVTVETPSFGVARALFAGLEAAPVAPERAGTALSELGITVRVRVRYATVARLGRDADPGPLERLVGLDAEVSPSGVLAALVRSA
jgi:hypothetical protein